MDLPECVYIMHISLCRSNINYFEIAVFCKISDGQVVQLPGNKNYQQLSFFICGICKSDIGYLGTICISFIYTLAVNRYLDSKMVNFRVLKIGFHGDTIVARQHNTDGIIHFSLKF